MLAVESFFNTDKKFRRLIEDKSGTDKLRVLYAWVSGGAENGGGSIGGDGAGGAGGAVWAVTFFTSWRGFTAGSVFCMKVVKILVLQGSFSSYSLWAFKLQHGLENNQYYSLINYITLCVMLALNFKIKTCEHLKNKQKQQIV